MRNLFNGTCDQCRAFKPRCAHVRAILRSSSGKTYLGIPGVLCPDCRKELAGTYRLQPLHRPVPRPKKAPPKTLFDKERA